MKYIIHILTLVVYVCLSYAQETSHFTDSKKWWRQARTMYAAAHYQGAKKTYQDIIQQKVYIPSKALLLQKEEAMFFIAMSSYKLHLKDTEKLFLDYIGTFHETYRRKRVYFYLADYYFNNKSYKEALTWFKKVRSIDLNEKEREAYHFKLGYTYFVNNNLIQADRQFDKVTRTVPSYYYSARYYKGLIAYFDKDYNQAADNFEIAQMSKRYRLPVSYYLSQIYFLQKDYDKTLEQSLQVINNKRSSYYYEANHIRGQAFFEKKDYTNAVKHLSIYMKRAKKVRKEDVYQLAFAQYKIGNYRQAIPSFKELSLLKDELGQNAMYALGDAYLKTNQKEKARAAFLSALDTDFDVSIKEKSMFNYAKLSYELKYYDIAIATLEKFIHRYPSSTYFGEATELLSQGLLHGKNYAKAIQIIERIKQKSNKLYRAYQKATYYRAVELFKDKKYSESVVLLDKSFVQKKEEKIYAKALFLKAEALFKQKKYKESISFYSQFLEQSIPDKELKKQAMYSLGYAYYNIKKYAKAQVYFDKSIELFNTPKDTDWKNDAILRLADCFFVNKKYRQAMKLYNDLILNNYRKSDYALYNKAMLKGLQGNEQGKIMDLKRLTKLYDKSLYLDDAYYQLGVTYQNQNLNEEALAAFDALIRVQPNSPFALSALMNKALSYYNKGNKVSAIRTYKRVVEKHTNTPEAKQSLSLLKDIYISQGKPNEYINYVKGVSAVSISASEQDSIVYLSAEELFLKESYEEAIVALSDYLNQYPNGFFAKQAVFYRAEAYYNLDRFENAYADYQKIISDIYQPYYERVLKHSARIAYYKMKNIDEAYLHYAALAETTSNQEVRDEADIQLVRISFELEKFNALVSYAEKIINENSAPKENIAEAHFYYAKTALMANKLDLALQAFEISEQKGGAWGAESQYNIAYIYYQDKDYTNALDACFKVRDKYASYGNWLAKSFILVADIYKQRDNIFQAKATLKSIIDNYKGDVSILQEAKNKYALYESIELEKSRIERQSEQDSIILKEEN